MQATEEQIKPNPNPNPNPNPHQVTEEQVKLLMRAERGERRAAAVEEEMTEMVRDRVRGRSSARGRGRGRGRISGG